jgi:transcriptional regulator of acetoin/glycerol metabolism
MELPTLNLKELERVAIEQAMRQADGSVLKAAKLLGIGRATLYRRLGRRLSSHPPPPDEQPAPTQKSPTH